MRGGRRDLLEQLQPFRRNAVFELGKAGDVASRPGQAFDDTEADRVDRIAIVGPGPTVAIVGTAPIRPIDFGSATTCSAAAMNSLAAPSSWRVASCSVASAGGS
jgi:hypothetical protein